MNNIIDKAAKLVEAVDFDNNGSMGRGGNGGLISRETMRACDELRIALAQHAADEKSRRHFGEERK